MAITAGDKIRFPRAIVEAASGCHPEFMLASPGELGEVIKCNSGEAFDYEVKADGWPHSFGADRKDFDPAE